MNVPEMWHIEILIIKFLGKLISCSSWEDWMRQTYLREIYLVKDIYQKSCLIFVNKSSVKSLCSLCTKKRQAKNNSHLTLVSLHERRSGLHIFTFCGPSIVINLRNKDQQDALFFLSLAASPRKCMINTICCIYSNCLLMMNGYSIQNT
jgi:hypothetical protein